jgi:hypothetical protein
MTIVDYSDAALGARLARAAELHRLATSLRDARGRADVERPVFEAIVCALAARFRAVEDLSSSYVWTAAVYWALAVDARRAVARSLGIDPIALDAPRENPRRGGFDFRWVRRANPSECVLAAESEWGHATNRKANVARVSREFEKLLRTEARYRVLVHAYHDSTIAELEHRLAEAAATSSAPSSFLVVGLSWREGSAGMAGHTWRLRRAGIAHNREDLAIPIA